jgi:hypothetical protein
VVYWRVKGSNMDVFETRRLNVVAYIEEKFGGNRAAFCRATGKNPNLINLVLTDNPDYRRNIGEKLARDIEVKASLPSGWLDAPRGVGERKTATIPITYLPWAIPDTPPLKPDSCLTVPTDDPALRIRVSGTANLIIVVQQESSMAPTIKVNDFIWVDLGVKAFNSDGVYVVRNSDGTTALKRIQQLSPTQFQLSVDDKTYEPRAVNSKAMTKLPIVGRVLCVWGCSML